MTAPSLVEFEDAVLAQLRTQLRTPAAPTNLFQVVEVYEGQFEAWLEAGAFDSPAALVYFDEATDEPWASAGHFRTTLKFAIYLAVLNYRGEEQSRRGGSSSEPGLSQLIDATRTLLAHQDLGLDMRPLQPQRWSALQLSDDQAGHRPLLAVEYLFEATWVWSRGETPEEAAAVDHETTVTEFDTNNDESPELSREITHT